MSEWDASALGWDEDPVVRKYAQAAFHSLELVLDEAGIALEKADALDFGCGTGLLTERLVHHGASVAAVDTSTAMLDVVRTKIADRGWTTVSTSTDLPAGRLFDVIVCSSVLGFVDNYPETVKALAAMLRAGGVFVQWDWELDEASDDPHGLSRLAIADALTAAGLLHTWVDVAFEIDFGEITMAPLIGRGQAAG